MAANDNNGKKLTLGASIREEFNIQLTKKELIEYQVTILNDKLKNLSDNVVADICQLVSEVNLPTDEDEEVLNEAFVRAKMDGKIPLQKQYDLGKIDHINDVHARAGQTEGYLDLHRVCKKHDVDIVMIPTQDGKIITILLPSRAYGSLKGQAPSRYPEPEQLDPNYQPPVPQPQGKDQVEVTKKFKL